MVFNQCQNEKAVGDIWGWGCPFSCPWWLQCESHVSSHQPADALSLLCHSLPGVFIEPDSSGAVEMEGFLLTEPCKCPAAKPVQALALQDLRAGAQQLEMQSDCFNGDVRDGANSFGAVVLLLTNFPSPLFHSLFLFPHHSSNSILTALQIAA